MAAKTDTPAGTVQRFSELLGEGRVDALVELYEDGAAFVPEPGRAVSGRESIRAELEQIVTMKPRMRGSVERVLQAGDTALVAYRWHLDGTTQDGASIQMKGVSADVLRRRPDGSWGVIIDDPYGIVGATDAGDIRGA
jgi:ketosteroid isomerase-like protein